MSGSVTSPEHTTAELACGIFEHRIEGAFKDALPFLEKISSSLNWYLVLNQKRFGEQPVPGWDQTTSGDLFENAPAEIRETDSLFVARFHLDQIDAEQLSGILSSDSMILLLSDLGLSELLDKQKIAWAWFSRQSILHQQLVHGSRTLAQTLFAGLKFAVLVDRSTTDLLVCGFSRVPA